MAEAVCNISLTGFEIINSPDKVNPAQMKWMKLVSAGSMKPDVTSPLYKDELSELKGELGLPVNETVDVITENDGEIFFFILFIMVECRNLSESKSPLSRENYSECLCFTVI